AHLDAAATRELVARFITVIGDAVGWHTGQLESAEHAYTAEQADDPPVREAREAAAADVYEGLMSGKQTATGFLKLRAYGLDAEPLSRPDTVRNYGRNVVQLLDADPRTVTTPLGSFNTAAAAAYLRPRLERLDAALAAGDREDRELKESL